MHARPPELRVMSKRSISNGRLLFFLGSPHFLSVLGGLLSVCNIGRHILVDLSGFRSLEKNQASLTGGTGRYSLNTSTGLHGCTETKVHWLPWHLSEQRTMSYLTQRRTQFLMGPILITVQSSAVFLPNIMAEYPDPASFYRIRKFKVFLQLVSVQEDPPTFASHASVSGKTICFSLIHVYSLTCILLQRHQANNVRTCPCMLKQCDEWFIQRSDVKRHAKPHLSASLR